MQNKPKVLTVPALKRFNARADVRAAIAAIKVTRERSERITAHVENYLAPAFAAFEPFYASGTRITDRADLYMCDDAQDAQCAAWYAHCDVLHASNGYNVREGYCPALVAQDERDPLSVPGRILQRVIVITDGVTAREIIRRNTTSARDPKSFCPKSRRSWRGFCPPRGRSTATSSAKAAARGDGYVRTVLARADGDTGLATQ